MPIRVRLHGRLKDLVGKEEIVIDKEVKTVRELLEELLKQLGEKARKEFEVEKPEDLLQPRSRLVILIDGFSIKLRGGLDAPLSNVREVNVDNIEVMEWFGGG